MIYYIYDASGNVIGLKYNNNIYYYEKNIQNDITGIMDDSFNLLATYEYDSWGNILSIKDTNGNTITDSSNIALVNPFRYRSYYYDGEIGMYYLNSRYYNQEWGRFINADGYMSTGTGLLSHNMYVYCSSNPVNISDPSGNTPADALEFARLNPAHPQKINGIMNFAYSVWNTKYQAVWNNPGKIINSCNVAGPGQNNTQISSDWGFGGGFFPLSVGISQGLMSAPWMGINRANVTGTISLDLTIGAKASPNLSTATSRYFGEPVRNWWQSPEVSCGALVFYNFQTKVFSLNLAVGCTIDFNYVVEWDR